MATTNVADRLIVITQAAFAELGEVFGLAEGAMGMGPCYAGFSGQDARVDAPYVNQLLVGAAGGPGGPHADGWPTYMIPVVASLLDLDSVEVDEQKYPIHVDERRLITDSEGAGRHRGAPGCIVSHGPVDAPMTAAYTIEAHHNPPRGVRGGQDGSPADGWKLDEAGNRVDIPKADAIVVAPGERIVAVTAGGGGYGEPRERDPERVREDVLEGWISEARASEVWGVALGDGPERHVDVAATVRLRSATAA